MTKTKLMIAVAGAIVVTSTQLFLSAVNATTTKDAQAAKQESKNVVINKDETLKFELQGCERKGQRVSCNLLITSLINENRDFQLYDKSRVFDVSGNEYPAKGVQFSNEKPAPYVTKALIPNVSIKANIVLEIPPQINNLAALEVYYWFDYQTQIDFRNVDITASQTSNSANP